MGPKKTNGLRSSDPPKTPKVWEKARREKMRIYFNELQEVLPLYDPSATMSRFEILQKSRTYIRELQNQNQDLLNGGFDEVYKNKMEKLKQRVKELLQRVDQLTDLLRRANIMIPPLIPCPEKQESLSLYQKWMNQRPKKWTEKVNVVVPDEKIENILSLIKDFKKKNSKIPSGKRNCKIFEKQSEKGQSGCLTKKVSFSERIELRKKKQLKRIKSSKITGVVDVNYGKSEDKTNSESYMTSQSPSHTKENQPVDFNLPQSEDPAMNIGETNGKSKGTEDHCTVSSDTVVEDGDKLVIKTTVNNERVNLITGKVKPVVESQNNVFLPASTNVMQSNTYILTNDGNLVQFPILNSSGSVINAGSNLLTQATIVNQSNSGILTPLVINRPSPLIVLQKPAPQIIQTAQIVNPTPQILSVPNQNLQILGNSIVCANSSQNTSSKTLPYILSKQPPNKRRITKDSTMTTYVNKIPIPALSKQSYVKKTVALSNSVAPKVKNQLPKIKDVKEKLIEIEKSSIESDRVVMVNEKEIQTEKFSEEAPLQNSETASEKIQEVENMPKPCESSGQKRGIAEEESANPKKQKAQEKDPEANVFKPIENPILSEPQMSNDGLFCNLKLPNSVGHNISVSPTAAFLSTFPIVASSKLEAEEELTGGKIDERRNCEEKNSKLDGSSNNDKGIPSVSSELTEVPNNKNCDLQTSANVPLENKEPSPAVNLNEDKICDSEGRQLIKPNCDSDVSNGLNSTINNINSNSSVANGNNGSINNISKDSDSTHINGTNPSNSNNNGVIASNIVQSSNQCSQLTSDKSWEEYHQAKNCEIRSDPFYINSDMHIPVVPPSIPDISSSMNSFPDAVTNGNSYKGNYPQNNIKTNFNVQNTIGDQIDLKNNHFDYGQKENFMAKRMNNYNDRNASKKSCTNTVNEGYGAPKSQPTMYQTESGPNYQLIPVKEMTGQRNFRAPVNWMTDPDIRTRSMSYGNQPDKMTPSKIPPYSQSDVFYSNNHNKPQSDISADYVLTDVSKMDYQKNDFYNNKGLDPQMKISEPRCKAVDKRSETKFPPKPLQNSYNIFDYNYNGNYFSEEDSNKFCAVQGYPSNGVKNKKNTSVGVVKKKTESSVHLINGDQQAHDTGKRNSDQVIPNMDFNPVGNQECFSWVPGKNVDWLPGKSFVDTNLILPSTLPTLVGDLALGTTTSNDVQMRGNGRSNAKPGPEPPGKSYMDLGLVNNSNFVKTTEPVPDNSSKQYLEPFTNLSKNIFDLTPSTNMQKSDCDKNGYLGNTNETIVLKNIFELPVSKSFANDYPNRNKQRPVNNPQNTFLSVSQLVETPNYESNSIKNETSIENNVGKHAESYPTQNYGVYHGNQKSFKNKNRNAHYKYNDRKYQGYKNASSNYTAEALIRSNANLTYQNGEYQADAGSNFYNGKNGQKTDNYPLATKNDYDKVEFVPCSTQNIYADFNFSSPVSNFNISTTVSADYVAHDGNFTQNNFFGDFIPPEYPITESVSNSLLLPPCSIALQNPFIIEKRNSTMEKSGKIQGKQYSNSRSRKNFDCSKTSYSDFSIGHSTASGIFTTSSIACPGIFTTTSCQNLLPVPNQNDPNITFSAASFASTNIPFPPLTTNANANYHGTGSGSGSHNPSSASFFPSGCPAMFTTCSTTTISSSRTCPSTVPPSTSSSAVITSSFSVGGAPFPSSSQSALPFLSLSNPIIPPSVPSTSGNSLANFNLSTIFPEINQKGNYHYP